MSWLPAALLALLGFSLLIILHELGHFFVARAVGMRVERFSLFLPPIVARYRPKGSETEYCIGAIPLGGYVKITGMNPQEEMPPEVAHRAYTRQAPWKRIVVILAGPAVNIVLAFAILTGLVWANGIAPPTAVVGETTPGAPAAGELRPADQILSADGQEIFGPGLSVQEGGARIERLMTIVDDHPCPGGEISGCVAADPVMLTVAQPGGEPREVVLSPRYDAERDRMLLGFSFVQPEQQAVGPLRAAKTSVDQMWFVTTTTVEVLSQLFFSAEAREQVSGPVGNYEATRQAFELSTERAVFLLGLISLSLGLINLFPFLPLDGGHILWATIEKIRGRAVPFAIMEKSSFVGIVLIGMLFLLGLNNDIGRIISGEGFGVR